MGKDFDCCCCCCISFQWSYRLTITPVEKVSIFHGVLSVSNHEVYETISEKNPGKP